MTTHVLQEQTTSEPSRLLFMHQLRRENRHLQTQLRKFEASLSSYNTINQNRDKEFRSLSQRLQDLERRLDQECSTSSLPQVNHRLVETQRELQRYADEGVVRLGESFNEDTAKLERKFEEVRVQLEHLFNMCKESQEQISGLENTFSSHEFLRNAGHPALEKIVQEMKKGKALLAREEVMAIEPRNLVTSIARSELNRKEQLNNLERTLIDEQIPESQLDPGSLAGTGAARGSSRYVPESVACKLSALPGHSTFSHSHPNQPLALPVEDEDLTRPLQDAESSSFPSRTHVSSTGQNTPPATTPQVRTVTIPRVHNEPEVDAGQARSLSQATTQPVTEIDLDDVAQQQQQISQSNLFRFSPPLLASANQSPTLGTEENAEPPYIASRAASVARIICPELLPQGIGSPRVPSPRAPSPVAPLPHRRKPSARASAVPPPTDRQTRSQARAAEAALQQSNPEETGKVNAAGAEDFRLNEQPTRIGPERAEKTSRSKKSSGAPRKRTTTRPKKSTMKTSEQCTEKRNVPEDSSNLAGVVKEEHVEMPHETGVAKKRKRH